MSVGHGGQVLCSQATLVLIDAEVALVDLGQNRLRDLDRHGRNEFGSLIVTLDSGLPAGG
jgi:hypothetical protein